MSLSNIPLHQSPAWNALQNHSVIVSGMHMRDLFADNPKRFERHSINLDDVFLDYSKNLITEETLALLVRLARQADVEGWREKMFTGKKVNVTEGKASLHSALRNRSPDTLGCANEEIAGNVEDVLGRMRSFSDGVRARRITGCTGKFFTDVVNIGIGGSDLGPAMVCEALSSYRRGAPKVHFVSNSDGNSLVSIFQKCDPERTLFIVSSKSFSTHETLLNADLARKWLTDKLGQTATRGHFVAVTANIEAAETHNVDPEKIFEFWPWVGGRFSLWSAAGLSIALSVGMDRFVELLDGAHAMDRHFCEAPLEENMPALLALIGIWNSNFLDASAHAVVPYDHRLRSLSIYLQQLEMESNGKCVSRDGHKISHNTAPIVFGAAGTNAQHSFFQALHQGTRQVSTDFIFPVDGKAANSYLRDIQFSNCLAQATVLMEGRHMRGLNEPAPEHKEMPGNRPSNTIILKEMDPYCLGMLLALYEHKVFVQGVIWGINPFDQWGVEIGKILATDILPVVMGEGLGDDLELGQQTLGMINLYKTMKERAS